VGVTLAATYHDPEGRMIQQIRNALPVLTRVFGGLAIRASHGANRPALDLFAEAGAKIAHGTADQAAERFKLGQARRDAIALGLALDQPFILHCDCDRMLHWAERYPEELAQVVRRVADADFTVIGRTPRAFESHPRIQRETEIVVNKVFATVSGRAWDVTAATRGLSRRAAQAILDGCPDVEVSTDVSWTLFLQQLGEVSLSYIETEGMEFETGDRNADRIAQAGGYAQWMDQMDADPRNWAHRLDLARVEVEGMLPYWNGAKPG
jgi:hypothetical protein